MSRKVYKHLGTYYRTEAEKMQKTIYDYIKKPEKPEEKKQSPASEEELLQKRKEYYDKMAEAYVATWKWLMNELSKPEVRKKIWWL